MQWVEGAYQKYTDMLADFVKFKDETNERVQFLCDKLESQSVELKNRVDHIENTQQKVLQKHELADNRFNEFEERRKVLMDDIDYLKKQAILTNDNKLDVKDAENRFTYFQSQINSNRVYGENVRNDLLTLENYCERYLPLNTGKVVQKILKPLFANEEDKQQRLERQI